MENTAYRNAMEVLARRRREAENDAARRREETTVESTWLFSSP